MRSSMNSSTSSTSSSMLIADDLEVPVRELLLEPLDIRQAGDARRTPGRPRSRGGSTFPPVLAQRLLIPADALRSGLGELGTDGQILQGIQDRLDRLAARVPREDLDIAVLVGDQPVPCG